MRENCQGFAGLTQELVDKTHHAPRSPFLYPAWPWMGGMLNICSKACLGDMSYKGYPGKMQERSGPVVLQGNSEFGDVTLSLLLIQFFVQR